MPENSATPRPRKGLLLRLLRILAWLLMAVALICVTLYLAFGPAQLFERLKPPPPLFPGSNSTEAPSAPVAAAPVPAPAQAPADSQELVELMMESIEDIWGEFLARGDYSYKKPKLVTYRGKVEMPCKDTGTTSGPFYCPGSMSLYLDLDHLDGLHKNAPEVGDFARSYVVAHEVAHHMQNLVGVNSWIKDMKEGGVKLSGPEGLMVAQELLADCLAGSWVGYAQRKYPWVNPDDVDKMLQTVMAYTQEQGTIPGKAPMRDPLTHGSLEQRQKWLYTGIETGDPQRCMQLFTGLAQ
jgi:hypothetical protein